jgi:hypothetical protein
MSILCILISTVAAVGHEDGLPACACTTELNLQLLNIKLLEWGQSPYMLQPFRVLDFILFCI